MGRSRVRRAALVIACAAPLLAACNAILGISDYSAGPCSGGEPCTVEAGADVTLTDAPTDAPKPDVVVVDAAGADPVSWARWVMPNYGDGAAPPVPGKTLTTFDNAADDGGLKDTVSSLVWRPVPTEEKGEVKFAAAEQRCANALPKGSWRLPTRIELVTLLDFTQVGPTADPKLGLEEQVYWTTSAVRSVDARGVTVTSQNWAVRFEPNNSGVLPKLDTINGTARAICIRGK